MITRSIKILIFLCALFCTQSAAQPQDSLWIIQSVRCLQPYISGSASGTDVFAAFADRAVLLFSSSETRNLKQLAEYSFGQPVENMCLGENCAYIFAARTLWVMDITVPSDWQQAGSLPIPAFGKPIASFFKGGHVYMLFESTLLVISVTDPSAPQVVSSISFSDALGMSHSGERLIVRFPQNVFKVYDLSSVTPVYASQITQQRAEAFIAIGRYLYISLSAPYRIATFSLQNASNPVEKGQIAMEKSGALLLQTDGMLWTISTDQYHQGFSLADSGRPASAVTFHNDVWMDTEFQSAFGIGHNLFMFHKLGTIQGISVEIPTQRSVGVHFKMAPNVLEVKKKSTYVYMLRLNAGLYRYDVESFPVIPSPEIFRPEGSPHIFEADSNYLYIASKPSGFRIYDITDFSAPVKVYEDTLKIFTGSMALKDHYLYAVEKLPSGEFTFSVYDIGDPVHPQLIKQLPVVTPSASSEYVFRSGVKYMVLFLMSGGFYIFDIQNPSDPVQTFYIAMEVRNGDYAEDDSYMVIARNRVIGIYTFPQPGIPSVASTTAVIDYDFSAIRTNNKSIIVCNSHYIRFYDVSDPSHLVWDGNLEGFYGSTKSVIWEDNLLVTGINTSQIRTDFWYIDYLLPVEETTGIPETYSLNQNFPNPFNAQTSIRFTLPKASNIDISIFNILGERVAMLAQNEYLQAGTYTRTFDAADLPSGVYLCRLRADDFSETMKMLLLK